MAVAHDAQTQSANWSTATEQTVSHDPVGVPKGVVVVVVQYAASGDQVSGVTYAGTALTRVRFDQRTVTEQGAVYVYFLGASVPTNDPATVGVTSTSTAVKAFVVSTVTAATTQTAVDVSNGADAGIIANPSLTLDYTDSLADWCVYYGIMSGLAAPVSTVQSGSTHQFGSDLGNGSGMWARKAGTGGTSTTTGYTAASDDVLHAGLVVAELVAAALPPILVMAPPRPA